MVHDTNRFSDYKNSGCNSCYSTNNPYDVNQSYLTDLPFSSNMIDGASELSSRSYRVGGEIYGAQFNVAQKRTNNYKKPFITYKTVRRDVPWLAAGCEKNYPNQLKEARSPAKNYEQIVMTAIPDQSYGAVVEKFSDFRTNNNLLILALVVCILLLLCKK